MKLEILNRDKVTALETDRQSDRRTDGQTDSVRWKGKQTYVQIINNNADLRTCIQPPQWHSGRTFVSLAGDRGSIPGRDIPKTLKQVVTAPLPNARQPV